MPQPWLRRDKPSVGLTHISLLSDLSFWLPAALCLSPAHHSALNSGFPPPHPTPGSPETFLPQCSFWLLFFWAPTEACPTSVLKILLPRGADLLSGHHHPSALSPPLISSPRLTGSQMPTCDITAPARFTLPSLPPFPCLCRGHFHPPVPGSRSHLCRNCLHF